MQAVRKQAMDGLSGASLRRLRSCGLVPLQGRPFLWLSFFWAQQKKVTRPRQRTKALLLLNQRSAANIPCRSDVSRDRDRAETTRPSPFAEAACYRRVGAAQAATSLLRSRGAALSKIRIKIKPKASATKAAGYFLLS